GEIEPLRLLRDRLRLHRAFEHGEAGKEAKWHVGRGGHGLVMGGGDDSRKAFALSSPQESADQQLRLIRLSRDVADLAHAVPIGSGDAGLASTVLAESEETLAAPAQRCAGAALALSHRGKELRRHIAVERGELPAGADHLLAARATLAAAEARPAAGRAGS